MNKDITNTNYKNEFNGYQEWYLCDKMFYRGNYINDNIIGYTEYHWSKITRYYIR